jgi:hypothetical protein
MKQVSESFDTPLPFKKKKKKKQTRDFAARWLLVFWASVLL